ncbi:sensor histidine kinase [Phenylobacterium montanum]|uniref:histidine kinase n=1 Tax=Phenylobacterium montanum TaxID=2823693 RepID=A0A975G2A8_9CAUL|nr:HAMP domain-containing sensor histidine kinase [Caulobacter sp. S6]QUD89289.1 HAMP domain-containing histidine kinase [Caulobacter sp. S6]
MIFRSSVTNYLTFLIGVLLSGLFVATTILAVQAWNVHAQALAIARYTNTDRTLIDAIVAVRAQIPQDATALITQDDPRATMDQAGRKAGKEVAEALAALQTLNLTDGGRYAALIRKARQEEAQARSALLLQAARPRVERDLSAVDGWRAAVHQSIDALDAASVAVNNTVRIDDPRVAELVQIRRISWSIRDNYGFQCSALRASVNSGLRPDARLRESLVGHRAIYAADWGALGEILMRPGLSSELRQDVALAQRATGQAQANVDSVVASLDGNNRPAIAGGDWTTLCDSPFGSILAIGQQAQAEAYRYADDLRAAALRNMLLSLFGLVLVVAFGGYAVINVRRRLTRPMRALTETIARLSRRELDDPVEAAGGPDELDSLARALENLRLSELEARRLQQAMSQFTANASHQMRTPLSILRVHIAVLSKRLPRDIDAFASLKDIEEAVERLQNLLMQLLVLARADAGEPASAEVETVDLRDVIESVIDHHTPQAAKAAVSIHFEGASSPRPAHLNTTLLAEILKNLVDNAITYNNPGGSVIVRLTHGDGQTIVEVEDDGPGIPNSELGSVFLRFYRLKRDSGRPGSGLGLAIVQAVAAKLKAEIQAGPGQGGNGLRVRIALPRAS